MIEMMEVEEGD